MSIEDCEKGTCEHCIGKHAITIGYHVCETPHCPANGLAGAFCAVVKGGGLVCGKCGKRTVIRHPAVLLEEDTDAEHCVFA